MISEVLTNIRSKLSDIAAAFIFDYSNYFEIKVLISTETGIPRYNLLFIIAALVMTMLIVLKRYCTRIK